MKQLLQPIEPRDNFVPALSLRHGLDAFVRDLHLSPQQGKDDLDAYDVVLLETDRGTRFLLLRYRGYPDDMVDVYIPEHMLGRRQFLREIVDELQVPNSAVTDLRDQS